METSLDDLPWELLPRYFDGSAAPDERAAVERWVSSGPARPGELDELRQLWRQAGAVPRTPNTAAAWLRVTADLGLPASRLPDIRELPADDWRSGSPSPRFALANLTRGRQWVSTAMRVAAVLAIGAAATLLWRDGRLGTSARGRETAFRDLAATRPGQRAEVRLPDGTRVLLGVASSLRIGTTYEECVRARRECGRDVLLSGEAYFDVSHDARRPFRVHTAKLVIEDLGTEFVAAAYPGDGDVRVVVAEGEVALRPREDTAATLLPTLRPGDLARVAANGEASLEHRANVDAYLAWTRGELVFDDTPIDDVARRLARWYDLDVRVDPKAGGSPALTATFRDQSPDRTLDVIAELLDLRYERHGRSVVLFRRRG